MGGMMNDDERAVLHRLDALEGHLDIRLDAMEHRITDKLRRIMTQQSDIDAAVSTLTGIVSVVATETDSLNSTAQAILDYIAANPQTDTTALDAIVAQVQTTQGNLASAVSNVGSVVPNAPAPTPPAGS
jgi:cell division FtsZ-interacting protein ZapD